MRNLKLRYNGEFKSMGPIDSERQSLLVPSIGGYVHFFYISANRLNLLTDCSGHRTLIEESTDLRETLQISNSFDSIILLLPANNILRISNALSGTDLSIVREKFQLCENCTTDFEATKIIFNPSGDKAVLLTTTAGLVFVVTGYLQPLYKINLYDEQTITRPSVGWGQKATQFKGYRKKNQSIDEGNDAARCMSDESCSDPTSYVSWRSDGTMFAVNYCYRRGENNCGERKIKIFTEEAALKYISEQNNALEGPISWKPSKGFIGAVQLIGENSRQICLLEQNALYHCSFQLPSSFRVNELCWNELSDVLAISVENEQEENRVLFWVNSNCNWYLKQSVWVDGKIHRIVWDSFKPYRLHVLTGNGYVFYEWTFKYDVSLPFSRSDYGVLIATINGSRCELSCPTESGLIPPPMYSFYVDLPCSLDAVVFPQCTDEFDRMSFIAVMGNRLALYVKENGLFTNRATYRLENVDVLSHWFWRLPRVLYFQATSGGHGDSASGAFLCRVSLETRNETDDSLAVSKIRLPDAISCIASFNNDGLLVNLANGSVFVLRNNSDDFGNSLIVSVSKTNFRYDRMELTELGVIGVSVDDDDDDHHNLHNDRYAALVVADKIRVAENVSDFFWSSPYLLYTTSNESTLVCCRIDESLCASSSPVVRLMDRKLEAGCRLVTVIGCTVILQHPRGNLETIVPRPFVLSYLHWMLDLKRYSEAFYFLRRMRVTYNMLFDHDPEAFLRNVELFLTQLSDRNGNERLKAFVGELDSKCYAADLYDDYYYRRTRKKDASRPDKLSTILDSLVTTMTRNPGEEYAELIITCLVKRGNLPRALKFAKERNLVSFLLKLVPGRNLFQAALSCYDLDLALAIAKMAQLDPKQYREQLDQLRAMPENRRQFLINEMAGNFEEALRCLIIADDDDADFSPNYLQFIEERNLYLSGLKLTDRMSDKHREICLLYAMHLCRTRSYDEAAAFYEHLGRYSEASRCYLEAGKWDECLALLSNDSEPDRMSLVDEIVERCCVDKNFTKAAEITYRYLNDAPKSIDLYLNGGEYNQALNLALSVRRPELTETIRSAVMANSYPHLWRSIAGFVDSITKHSDRLKTIKESKLTVAALQDEVDDDFDVYSREPSLVGSGRSSSGTVSSRKTEKRLWSLKEGNPREEIALYKQLRSDLSALYQLTEETGTLCRVLIRLNEISRASKLQKHLKNALAVAETVKSIVWSCSTADRLRRYDDVFVRCLPVDVHSSKSWEVPFLNDF